MWNNDAAQQGPVEKTTHSGKYRQSAEQSRAFKKLIKLRAGANNEDETLKWDRVDPLNQSI